MHVRTQPEFTISQESAPHATTTHLVPGPLACLILKCRCGAGLTPGSLLHASPWCKPVSQLHEGGIKLCKAVKPQEQGK